MLDKGMGRRGLPLENHFSSHMRYHLCTPATSQEDSTREMCGIFLGDPGTETAYVKKPARLSG